MKHTLLKSNPRLYYGPPIFAIPVFLLIVGFGPGGLLSLPGAEKKKPDPPSVERYLLGQFNPAKHPDFIALSSPGIPTNEREHYLRRETALALKKMIDALRKDHPEISLRVISSTRNFDVQKSIWEAKWTGRRKAEGKYLPQTHPDPYRRGIFILRYSSMPGTSRHHWGTDFDINNLDNGYFERGEGLRLFRWLEKNAARFGFCRPYTADREKGYQEEKWHWSYRPLASVYLREWLELYGRNPESYRRAVRFDGSDRLSRVARDYVESVSPECR